MRALRWGVAGALHGAWFWGTPLGLVVGMVGALAAVVTVRAARAILAR